MQYIDFIVDTFENEAYTASADYLPLFIKFEFMAMQSLTVILGDRDYSEFWSDKAKTRLLNYSMIVLFKAAGLYNPLNYKHKHHHSHSQQQQHQLPYINHIFYAEQNMNKHSLAHTIMTITELVRFDANMRLFYKNHKPFKQLIVSLYKKYGAKSKFINLDPGISYALNHLIRVLYIQNINRTDSNEPPPAPPVIQKSLQSQESMARNVLAVINSNHATTAAAASNNRKCSNPVCTNEETRFKPFKECPQCGGQFASYCGSKCKNAHLAFHLKSDCVVVDPSLKSRPQPTVSGSASSLQTQLALSAPTVNKTPVSRRASDNFFTNLNDEMGLQQQQQHNQYQQPITSTNKTKMPKYKSSLESTSSNQQNFNNNPFAQNRRSSFNVKPGETQQQSQQQQQPHFIKNKPSFNGEAANVKPKIMNGFLSIGKQMGIRSAATAASAGTAVEPASSEDGNNKQLQFARPLKTSTALCLTDLTSRPKQVMMSQFSTPRPEQSIINGLANTKIKHVNLKFI
jgi:hypothetical protein